MTPAELIATMARDRLRIANLLDGKFPSARVKRTRIWTQILEIEIATGSMFLVAQPEGLPFLYVGLTQEILAIPNARRGGDRFWAYLKRRYGIGEQEDNHSKHVLSSFRSYAFSEGSNVDLRRFAAFNTTTRVAYISGYNGTQWRIDGQNVLPIANGEDDTFFIDDDGGVPIEPQIGPNGVLFDQLIGGVSFGEGLGGITAEQMKRALIVWMFALALPDLMPTKPLLIVEGGPGSGKSAFCKLLQLALMGRAKPISLSASREDDFPIVLLRSPLCVFDNVDSYIPWLPDKVCAYTTTGEFPRRKLFTDNEELSIKPHSFIAVASKNPASFRREDTADRLIILRLERRDTSGLPFIRLQALEENILNMRPQLLGEYLYYVNLIVEEIRNGVLDEQQDERFRMGDFAALARVVGKVLDWPEGAVPEMLNSVKSEQTSFFNEADPLTDLLRRWLAWSDANKGRMISSVALHHELENIASRNSIKFYSHSNMLQKMRSPHIERDFIVTVMLDGDTRLFRIWRKTDLRSIPMPAVEAKSDDDDDGEIGSTG